MRMRQWAPAVEISGRRNLEQPVATPQRSDWESNGVFVFSDSPVGEDATILRSFVRCGLIPREVWTARMGSSFLVDLGLTLTTAQEALPRLRAIELDARLISKPAMTLWSLRSYHNDDA